jgi:pimeloyl-ACP methyl ester carboxylesterase
MFLEHPDGTRFYYLDEGDGVPFIFQHGLGGSVEQAHELIGGVAGIRLISMDCRNHGKTMGKPWEPLTTNGLAGDLSWFIGRNLTESFFIGGLSLGALLAVKVALDCPLQIRGIVLLRPAWPDSKCNINFEALQQQSAYEYHSILTPSSSVALAEIGNLSHRVLVLGMPDDSLHPTAFAQEVAASFQHGTYVEVPNKRQDETAYKVGVRKHVTAFFDAA